MQVDDFGHFFGRWPYGRSLFVEFLEYFFCHFFTIYPRKLRFLVTVYNIFLTNATTLRTLISYFDSREKSAIVINNAYFEVIETLNRGEAL